MRVLARWGWADEKVAFLSILREGYRVVLHVQILEPLTWRNSVVAHQS